MLARFVKPVRIQAESGGFTERELSFFEVRQDAREGTVTLLRGSELFGGGGHAEKAEEGVSVIVVVVVVVVVVIVAHVSFRLSSFAASSRA
jgi:hypothetical protein